VIHATSADWKWIFSYPEEDIETINYVNVPEDHPILFKITSADSMSSFWVPQIGGQEMECLEWSMIYTFRPMNLEYMMA
jgi:cytochrome aa3-600 menaquinol oxidase subunit 2